MGPQEGVRPQGGVEPQEWVGPQDGVGPQELIHLLDEKSMDPVLCWFSSGNYRCCELGGQQPCCVQKTIIVDDNAGVMYKAECSVLV